MSPSHIINLSVGISRKVGLLRKCKVLYDSNDIVLRSFYSFILPHFEYCSPIWLSAADSHFRLLDRAFSMIRFLIPDLNISLHHRRLVGSICLFFKVVKTPTHPLHLSLPPRFVSNRITRYNQNFNSMAFQPIRCQTNQYSRSFFPSMIKIWNTLPEDLIQSSDMHSFKRGVNKYLLRGN